MERKQIIANASIVGSAIIFLATVMWYLPEMAIDLLTVSIVSLSLTMLILWVTKIDQRKDERTIQLMTLGGRNAFMFLVFAMPWLAGFSVAGIISIDAFGSLMLLWSLALGITWISFFYYYTR